MELLLLIGASGYSNFRGYAKVYENIEGVWTQIGQDIIGESVDDAFGSSISMSSEGHIIAIGAFRNDGNGVNSGHARVFENVAGNWAQMGQDINGRASYDNFGKSVSLSSSGLVVAIGGPTSSSSSSDIGYARILEYVGNDWTQVGLDIDGEEEDDYCGERVSLSMDGNSIAIGALIEIILMDLIQDKLESLEIIAIIGNN